jgi:hypothetical protein
LGGAFPPAPIILGVPGIRFIFGRGIVPAIKVTAVAGGKSHLTKLLKRKNIKVRGPAPGAFLKVALGVALGIVLGIVFQGRSLPWRMALSLPFEDYPAKIIKMRLRIFNLRAPRTLA